MTTSRLLALTAACGFLAASAHAQYAAARSDSYSYDVARTTHAQWEVDAGIGYLFNTNISGLDDGWTGHVAGYYRDAFDRTNETSLKYGAEFIHADVSGNNSVDLETNMVLANAGIEYRLSRQFGLGIVGGVGMGRLTADAGGASDSSTAFGFQVRPEAIAYINEKVALSLAYRYLHTFPLDSDWNENPAQHALELSVKVRF